MPHQFVDSYPVWDKVIQPQPIRIRVRFPTVFLVIDLWKFKGYNKKKKYIYVRISGMRSAGGTRITVGSASGSSSYHGEALRK